MHNKGEGMSMSNGTFWQLVFTQSKVNGAAYLGDRLPSHSWDWPKDTFLQRRLSELRKRPLAEWNMPQHNDACLATGKRKQRARAQRAFAWRGSSEQGSCVERQ
jgi:hypothetical protein